MSMLVLGTSSGCGKTTLAAMFCRYFAKNGVDVAPFKGFNLSADSVRTEDGGEIGYGQSFQSLACGLDPVADMNPVLSKFSDGSLKLLVKGKDGKGISHEDIMRTVKESYDSLSSSHKTLVCEGSGSPVELNMMDRDIANTGLMKMTDVQAVIVADIELGGAFAALYGTWLLMPDELKPRLKGFVINRFRGDASILKPAINRIEELTDMRCLGVIRYDKIRFPDEDSLSAGNGKNIDDAECLSGLDLMIEHAMSDGFDFASLESICL